MPGIGDLAMNMSDPINPSGTSVYRATPNGIEGFKNYDGVKGKHGRDTNQSGGNWLRKVS